MSLEARAQDLRALIEATRDNRKPVELDQVAVGRLSRMDALQGQAMACAAEQNYQRELARIVAALRRIEEGRFGSCAECGEAIDPRRLAADPTIAICIDCARARS
ncbi:MAG: TraR/DksA family transcriptional regulator [Parvularculaceae bacterium]